VIRFADLFCGIGGFRLGIENASKKLGIPVECVFSSEIEKNAVKIYEKNFKETPSGDITKIQANDIPDMDILCGGFPCQDVSSAGNRVGLCGARSGLFFEIIRIAKEKQPKIIFLENVKGLFSSDKGRDFARVLIALDDIGYDVEWQCIDTAYYLPQHRERVFIIGHLRDGRTRKIFPLIRETEGVCDESKKSKENICQTASTLTKRQYASWNENYVIYPVLDPKRENKSCNGRRIKDENEPSFTLTKQDRHGVMINNKIRVFTPVECERLQGFPELESSIYFQIHNNTICLDLQKSYVNVEIRNHKLQKCVGNVERNRLQNNALYVEKNSNQNYLQINKHVQKNVRINCVENRVEIHNQENSYSYVNFVESRNSYLPHIKIEDFVQMIVGINTICEKIIQLGKVELLQNEHYSIHQENGKMFVKLSGSEMTQRVEDVEKDITILRKHLNCITSNHLSTKNIDSNLITSFCYVISAIIGCIQEKTQIESSLNLEIYSRFGWTYGISDNKRRECLGNAVTVNVIEAIAEQLLKGMI